MTTCQKTSSFFDPGLRSSAGSLAILHLKRDSLQCTKLSEYDDLDEGYEEGRVTNTRFGSYPHSTLIGVPWGSQVRASDVDTGSRGRRIQDRANKKRKRDQDDAKSEEEPTPTPSASAGVLKTPKAASTGFAYLLPATPETWTASLPHRTQVVYTPDYSYILHRLRARPGSRLIEAGAGSGSFSHAAARAVFNGYPALTPEAEKNGKVFSFEFHEERVSKFKVEIRDHGLEDIIDLTHRDVYQDGFSIDNGQESSQISPEADAIFLDLPAPWLALPHLSRTGQALQNSKGNGAGPRRPFVSPLNTRKSVYICTFSPCIEQAQKTISTMRQLGWIDIDMVEIAHKKLEVRRERVGLHEEGVRGINSSAANVGEAVDRLRELEQRFKAHQQEMHHTNAASANASRSKKAEAEADKDTTAPSDEEQERKLFKEGRLVHRPEPEIKNHTSYLVFAVLAQEWTEVDEIAACEKWPLERTKNDDTADTQASSSVPKNKRKQKREARLSVQSVEGVGTLEEGAK